MAATAYHIILSIIICICHSQTLDCTSDTGQCIALCNADHTNVDGVQDCTDTNLKCPAGRDCSIDCYHQVNSRRLITHSKQYTHSRSLQDVYNCGDGQYGCCGSNITCAANQSCVIDCERGCGGLTIHAETASSLTINNCQERSGNSECGNMEIYCPRNGHRGATDICQIDSSDNQNEWKLESTNIYTEEGWNDLVLINLKPDQGTYLWCGRTGKEYNCELDSGGRECNDPSPCDNFILPTFEPTVSPTSKPTSDPTIIPTNVPTSDPTTFEPTVSPSINPTYTYDPTTDPTNDPTTNPTDNPTTKTPTTSYPTESPTTMTPTKGPTAGSGEVGNPDDNNSEEEVVQGSGKNVGDDGSALEPWMFIVIGCVAVFCLLTCMYILLIN